MKSKQIDALIQINAYRIVNGMEDRIFLFYMEKLTAFSPSVFFLFFFF